MLAHKWTLRLDQRKVTPRGAQFVFWDRFALTRVTFIAHRNPSLKISSRNRSLKFTKE
jgi:hypothetical protein